MNAAVIVAGGCGVRFGRAEGKQLIELAGKPMLQWTIDAFMSASSIDAIVIVSDASGIPALADFVNGWNASKVDAIVPAGKTRQDSVAAGLAALGDRVRVVAIHDGARPLVLPSDIDACVAALPGSDGVVLGRPAVDTMKRVDATGAVAETPDRRSLWQAETPQVFGIDVIRKAHAVAAAGGMSATDDATLVELAGGRVRLVAATGPNLKVTLPGDAILAAAVLDARAAAREGGSERLHEEGR